MIVDKPAPLRPGSRIGVVAPAGCVEEADLLAGVAAVRAQGFEVEWSEHVLVRKGYLAGDEKTRAADLIGYFRRSDIDAIFCARGGFGSVQILPLLERAGSLPAKIFCGYSDITVLLNWLAQHRRMVTFHAPMVAMDLARPLGVRTQEQFWRTLTGKSRGWTVELGTVIRPGRAEAPMIGGCLSLLVSTLATPYEIDTAGKILFLEDIGERPYRIERMLTHLKMAGKLRDLAGVVCGDFTDCGGSGPRDWLAVVKEIFSEANYPVVLGLQAGHGVENLTLPFGVMMRLDSNNPSLSLLEAPVS